MNKSELFEFLQMRTTEVWDSSKQPYYLARVQPELRDSGKNYREATGEQTLATFAEAVPGIRVVRHPHKKAKIGLVPASSPFEFSEMEGQASTEVAVPALQSRSRIYRPGAQRVIADFMQLLSTLDDNDLKDFHIPALVLAKLLRSK
ncbi:hypothetical protein [Paragemmobacter straminiformis]|uniref:Uncharacterized protein n=1 Tax=Paragemmobacter straminiformis TaxID=2045119 RepID=A0A842I6Z8_9RHOB|nr:hypothetical protein [Gemmobacter straminiformis]MBC2835147.1 hypothetical protein [Gemmobacter straminiformis]